MAISVMSAALTACEESDWTLTNLALQKLLYLSHMKFIGAENGPSLIRETFEAWKYGPVVPRLYERVKKFGAKPIANVFPVDRNILLREHITIRGVVRNFADKTPGQLVELTHRADGAWDNCYDPRLNHVVIPNYAIAIEFQQHPF